MYEETDRYRTDRQSEVDLTRESFRADRPPEVEVTRESYQRTERQPEVELTRESYQHTNRQPEVELTRESYLRSGRQQPEVEFARQSYNLDIKNPEVELTRESYREPTRAYKDSVDIEIDRRQSRDIRDSVNVEAERHQFRDQYPETQIDITEREYRRRTNPNYDIEYQRSRPREEVRVQKETTTTTVSDKIPRNDMGYYDDDGNYHSFRRGVERAADRILHPFHPHHGSETEVQVNDDRGPTRVREGVTETVRFVEPRGGVPSNTVTIPCHFIRIGDLLILQGRPCQVIRITTSSQTGQHRYLGVDLFTRQLHEESSFVSNPSPSVVVQSMLGPVFKQYRILDMREDGKLVAMTETGDVKQGLSVIDQGGLYAKIDRAFADGRGSVRALVINDGGRELVVDYKIIHGSRL